jgi:hypothetical protein
MAGWRRLETGRAGRRMLLMVVVVLDPPVKPVVPDSAIMLGFCVAKINLYV